MCQAFQRLPGASPGARSRRATAEARRTTLRSVGRGKAARRSSRLQRHSKAAAELQRAAKAVPNPRGCRQFPDSGCQLVIARPLATSGILRLIRLLLQRSAIGTGRTSAKAGATARIAAVKEILGLILGGGKGTRLFPLTLIRSKPAVPLGGKYRLVDIPISNCINSGINRIFVLTQYNSESLNRHITQTYRFGLFSQGFVDILAAEQTPDNVTWYQGTADAVRQSLRHILTYRPKYILILSGDHLYRMDYRQLLEQHRQREAEVSLCVLPVTREQAPQLGILKMDNQGRITEFVEKPREPEEIERLKVDVDKWREAGVTEEKCLLASMGIYLFNTDTLVKVLREEPKMDFGRDIIPAALPRYKVFGYVFDGYWEDIGTIEAFYRANLGLTAEKPKFTFYVPDAPIYSHPRFLPPSRILDCRLERSIVSEGCEIRKAAITESVIGIRSVICEGAEIRRTLVLGADYFEPENPDTPPMGIGPGCVISQAIIDKNARIGANCRIVNDRGIRNFDGENYYIRDGIVIIPKNAKIPEGTVI